MPPPLFDHEKLRVYQAAIAFVAWVSEHTNDIPKAGPARKHLDEAATSIVPNIAEGNGKFAIRDRRRYFDISLGSAFECAGSLDILAAQHWLDPEIAAAGKQHLQGIVSMLIGLIKNLDTRLAEDGPVYTTDNP